MKILLVDAGEVGFNLAKYLSKEDYDITVIDIDPIKCKRIKNTIDAHVIEGDASSQRVYDNIDMESIDYFLPLTRYDEVNLVASMICKKKGVKKIIARLRNTEYIHKDAVIKPHNFGIDYVTYPEKAAVAEIESLIKQTSAVEVQEFKNGKITVKDQMVGFEMRLVDTTSKKTSFLHAPIASANPSAWLKKIVFRAGT